MLAKPAHLCLLATCDACAPSTGGKEVLVERFSFSSEVASVPRGNLLDRVTVAPPSAPISERSPFQAAVFDSRRGDESLAIRLIAARRFWRC
jgi:hypothetical protein